MRLRLAEGIGIQHFNSGSAYSTMRPGEDQRRASLRHRTGRHSTNTRDRLLPDPCSDGRIVTRMRLPSFGALATVAPAVWLASIIFLLPCCRLQKCRLAIENGQLKLCT